MQNEPNTEGDGSQADSMSVYAARWSVLAVREKQLELKGAAASEFTEQFYRGQKMGFGTYAKTNVNLDAFNTSWRQRSIHRMR